MLLELNRLISYAVRVTSLLSCYAELAVSHTSQKLLGEAYPSYKYSLLLIIRQRIIHSLSFIFLLFIFVRFLFQVVLNFMCLNNLLIFFCLIVKTRNKHRAACFVKIRLSVHLQPHFNYSCHCLEGGLEFCYWKRSWFILCNLCLSFACLPILVKQLSCFLVLCLYVEFCRSVGIILCYGLVCYITQSNIWS